MKYGTGIEMTMEALLKMLQQRFPNGVEWEHLKAIPELSYDAQKKVISLHWQMTDFDESIEGTAEHSIFRIGEGAPTPIKMIRSADIIADPHAPDSHYIGTCTNCQLVETSSQQPR